MEDSIRQGSTENSTVHVNTCVSPGSTTSGATPSAITPTKADGEERFMRTDTNEET
ncbi:hypothetical protein GCM10008992_05480 [Halorubrum aquaticum]